MVSGLASRVKSGPVCIVGMGNSACDLAVGENGPAFFSPRAFLRTWFFAHTGVSVARGCQARLRLVWGGLVRPHAAIRRGVNWEIFTFRFPLSAFGFPIADTGVVIVACGRWHWFRPWCAPHACASRRNIATSGLLKSRMFGRQPRVFAAPQVLWENLDCEAFGAFASLPATPTCPCIFFRCPTYSQLRHPPSKSPS